MKTLLLICMAAFSTQLMAQNYNAAKAHEDSVFIYETYKDQIAFLEKATKESNFRGWYARSNHDDSITTCPKIRLKKWNKEAYQMSDIKEYEGYGTAYAYPDPSATRKIKFSITDVQTKFITRPDGKTKLPYVEKINYDGKGAVVSIEQLYSMKND